jgi:hypothetical protein
MTTYPTYSPYSLARANPRGAGERVTTFPL